MNTYKISYQFPGSSYEDAVVTAPDQRAAERLSRPLSRAQA